MSTAPLFPPPGHTLIGDRVIADSDVVVWNGVATGLVPRRRKDLWVGTDATMPDGRVVFVYAPAVLANHAYREHVRPEQERMLAGRRAEDAWRAWLLLRIAQRLDAKVTEEFVQSEAEGL